ncbi:MAG: CPBP family intramembrane glutamic endopeptidase [Acidobacteriota bacterium]
MEADRRRGAIELALVVACGAANVFFETVAPAKTAFVLVALLVWGAYLGARLRATPVLLRDWGLRTDTAMPALRVTATATLPALVALVGYAFTAGHFPPPRGFWIILLIYPAWGIAQQFLLNAMLASNLRRFLPGSVALLLAAVLFSLSHAPDLPVMALTLPVALLWAWIYARWPNLWVLGIAHGIIGTVVFYGVLGRDPLAAFLH